LRAMEREVDADLQSATRVFLTLECHALEAIRALAPLAQSLRGACGNAALPRLRELCANVSAGWYIYTSVYIYIHIIIYNTYIYGAPRAVAARRVRRRGAATAARAVRKRLGWLVYIYICLYIYTYNNI